MVRRQAHRPKTRPNEVIAQRENPVLSQLQKHIVKKKDGNKTQEDDIFDIFVCACLFVFPFVRKLISCLFTSAGCGNDSVPRATGGVCGGGGVPYMK